MPTNLSDDLRQAIAEHGGVPMYVLDDASGVGYVLMRAEEFEKIRSLIDDEDIEAMYPLLGDIDPDDWEDISQYDRNP